MLPIMNPLQCIEYGFGSGPEYEFVREVRLLSRSASLMASVQIVWFHANGVRRIYQSQFYLAFELPAYEGFMIRRGGWESYFISELFEHDDVQDAPKVVHGDFQRDHPAFGGSSEWEYRADVLHLALHLANRDNHDLREIVRPILGTMRLGIEID